MFLFAEQDRLFRFWASEIMTAMADVVDMCTLDILDPLSLANFVVADGGTSVMLANVTWGPDLRDGGIAGEGSLPGALCPKKEKI